MAYTYSVNESGTASFAKWIIIYFKMNIAGWQNFIDIFNKNWITTMVQIAPNGTVLVSSMIENYSTGDNVRFYANFFSTDNDGGMFVGTYYKINFINTYQSF